VVVKTAAVRFVFIMKQFTVPAMQIVRFVSRELK